jgi:hypothetical protein
MVVGPAAGPAEQPVAADREERLWGAGRLVVPVQDLRGGNQSIGLPAGMQTMTVRVSGTMGYPLLRGGMVDTVTGTEAAEWTAMDDSGEITSRPVTVGYG